MKLARLGVLAAAAAVLSVTAVLSATAVASLTAPLTAKRALLQGVPAPVRVVRDPDVSRLIVKFREDAAGSARAADRSRRLQQLATDTRTDLRELRATGSGASLVSLPGAVPLSAARALAARLAADPSVEYAEPDVMFRRLAIPNETRYGEW